MPDQELTALRIKIEADIDNAIKKLDELSKAALKAEDSVAQMVNGIKGTLGSLNGVIGNAFKDIDREVSKKRTAKIDAKVDTTNTITEIKRQLDSLKDKRALIKISGDLTELNEINRQIAFVENRLKVLTGTKFTPVIDRSSLDNFISGVKSGFDVTINDLKAFKAEADKLLRFAPKVERAELANISRFLGEEIKKASAAAEIKPTLDLSGIANATFNKLKVGAEVSIDDLVKAKQFFENQRLTLTADADLAEANDKIKLLAAEAERRRTLTLDANTAPAQNKIDALKIVNSVVLGIDVSLDELQQAKAALKRERLTVKGDIELAEFNRKTGIIEGEIQRLENLQVQIKPLDNIVSPGAIQQTKVASNEIRGLWAEINRASAANTSLATSKAGLAPTADKAAQSLKAFEQVLRDSPSFAYSASQGLIAISNNIGPLTDRFGELKAAAKESGQSVGSALLAAARSPLGITIGISALVSIVTILVSKFQQAGSAAKDLAKDTDDAKQSIDGITNTIAQEAAQVSGLVSFIKQETTTREEKAAALKKLSGINQSYFGELKNEEGLITSLNRSYAAYIDSLLNTAKAKAATELLTKELQKLLNLQLSIDPKFNAIDLNLDIAASKPGKSNGQQLVKAYGDDIRKSFDTTLPGLQTFVGGKINDTFQKAGKQVENGFLSGVQTFDLAKTNRSINEQLNKVDFLKNFLGQFQSLSNLDLDFGGADKKVKDFLTNLLQAEKELLSLRLENLENFNRKYVEKFSALQKSLSVDGESDFKKRIIDLEFQIKVLGIDPNDPNAGKLRELFKLQAEEQLKGVEVEATDLRLKIGLESVDVTEFNKQLELFRDRIREAGVTGKDDIKTKEKIALPEFVFDDRVTSIEKDINKVRALFGQDFIPKGVFDDLLPQMENFNTLAEYQAAVLAKLYELYGQSQEGLKAFAERLAAINKEIANILASGLSELFNDLFDAIAQDGKLTFEELSTAVGKFVQDLIKATAKLLIFKAIANALGVGSASDLLGPLVRPRRFATGGIITGPTFGMVGESGTEAVLPLNYLNNLLSDVGGSANLQARVSGDDLLFVMSRANKRNNRFF